MNNIVVRVFRYERGEGIFLEYEKRFATWREARVWQAEYNKFNKTGSPPDIYWMAAEPVEYV
jgi:hypothetical protein